ncbi:hypothetical protein RJ55_07549 [Drechmeria coniospora]|nr:hypothetical protein RJ55_07549 [Drechmeria coniospora]
MQERHDAMANRREWRRMGFRDALEIVPLPPTAGAQGRRYMSQRPAWTPGGELPWEDFDGPRPKHSGPGVFGGHVYAQAPLAAARAVEEDERRTASSSGSTDGRKIGIHSIQGVFTNPGLGDRPFIYDVSTIAAGRSFSARLVHARQPKQASKAADGPYPPSDAQLPLNDICFSCITTFKRAVPSHDDMQMARSAQERYAHVLSTRPVEEWDLCPQSDVDIVKALFPNAGHGAFPVLDMHKVDMSEYNGDKAVPERRELIFYRLLEPLPRDDANAHILCHAFEADRNGLIMCGNHLGYGYNLGTAASLSYSFYVHVNPDEAVMDGDGWWLQEVSWPRVSAGRCMMESRLWSPEGKHVASGYQDGIIGPERKKGEAPSKL